MPRELVIDQNTDAQAAVREAVTVLEAGELVCLPDECGWNLLGLATRESSATAMTAMSAAPSMQPAISIAHPAMIADLAVDASRLFQKLTTRCWPGPVVLRNFPCAQETNGLIRQWPAEAQFWGMTDRGRAFYCPAESISQEVLRSLSGPVLSLLGTGPNPVSESGRLQPSLVIRSTLSRFSAPPTVVSIERNHFMMERPGVVSERMLARLAGEVYLFVCTGNTCRSPMAEAIFRKMLADRLKCREDELMDHGYVVISAGLAAYKGAPAAPESIELLRHDGIDLSGHESQPVTEELLFHCDHIVTMTRSHRDAVLSSYPELSKQVRLLSPRSDDIPDPIGAGMDEYMRCREIISSNLESLLLEIDSEGDRT